MSATSTKARRGDEVRPARAAEPAAAYGQEEAADVAVFKRHFSAYLDRVLHRHERVIVRRRGKRVAALVPLDEVATTRPSLPGGLEAAAGALGEFLSDREMDKFLRRIYRARLREKPRAVPPLDE